MRWVVLFFFCMFNLSNNLQWITFATVVDQTKAFFDCSAFQVNSLAWIYSLLYVFLAFPCSGLYDKFGLRRGMMIGAALNGIGASLKLVAVYAYPNFGMLMFAQLFNAVAQCFTLGLPPMVAAAWFGTNERSLATSLAAVSNILGAAIGFPLPPSIVWESDLSNKSSLEHQFGVLFAVEMAMCCFTAAGVSMLVQDGPADAPAVTARRNDSPGSSANLLTALKKLLSNRSFVLLAIAMGCSNGMFGGLSTLLAQINAPFGISNSQTGWMGCVGSFASIGGSIAVGMMIDRLRRYKLPLLVLSLLVTLCISAVMLSYVHRSAPLVNAYVWFTLLQIVESCVCAVVFEYSVELTYPMPEALSGTALMVLPNLFNFLIVISSSFLLGNNPPPGDALGALAICCAVAFASGFACLFLGEDLRRLNVEKVAVLEEVSDSPTSVQEG